MTVIDFPLAVIIREQKKCYKLARIQQTLFFKKTKCSNVERFPAI